MKKLTTLILLALFTLSLAGLVDEYRIVDEDDDLVGTIDEEGTVRNADGDILGYLGGEMIKDADFKAIAYIESGGEQLKIKNTSFVTKFYLESDGDVIQLMDRSFDVLAEVEMGEAVNDDDDLLVLYEQDEITGNNILLYLLFFTDMLD